MIRFWHLVFCSNSLFSTTVLILPFVVLEYWRIRAWLLMRERKWLFQKVVQLETERMIPGEFRQLWKMWMP
jgi:hypothetical protein